MSGLDALHGEIEEDLERSVGDCASIRYVHFVGQLFDEYATRPGSNSPVT
jgi:hypothetical protein